MPVLKYQTKKGSIFEYDGDVWSAVKGSERKEYPHVVFLSGEGIKPTRELADNGWMTAQEIVNAGNDPMTGRGGYLAYVGKGGKLKITEGIVRVVEGDSGKPLKLK